MKIKRLWTRIKYKLFRKRYKRENRLNDSCYVDIGKDGFVYLFMPDGTKIPRQTGLILHDNIWDQHPKVKIELLVNIGKIDNKR